MDDNRIQSGILAAAARGADLPWERRAAVAVPATGTRPLLEEFKAMTPAVRERSRLGIVTDCPSPGLVAMLVSSQMAQVPAARIPQYDEFFLLNAQDPVSSPLIFSATILRAQDLIARRPLFKITVAHLPALDVSGRALWGGGTIFLHQGNADFASRPHNRPDIRMMAARLQPVSYQAVLDAVKSARQVDWLSFNRFVAKGHRDAHYGLACYQKRV